jgi:hypothetical protein
MAVEDSLIACSQSLINNIDWERFIRAVIFKCNMVIAPNHNISRAIFNFDFKFYTSASTSGKDELIL